MLDRGSFLVPATMKILLPFLTLYSWIMGSILLFFLFRIARFFSLRHQQKKGSSHSNNLYMFLLVPIAFFIAAAIIYATTDASNIVGVTNADTLRLLGGVIVISVGISLLNTMVGGKS